MFSVDEVRRIYADVAGRYDRLARLFPLFGFRTGRYRRDAVAALELAPGDTVVELGCGTGLNFRLLKEAVGQEGRIVGVDLTAEMLDEARRRVERHDWEEVDLVEADVAEYRPPEGVDGVLSTFALTLSPAYDEVVRRAASVLAPGGRMAVCDFKRPEGWPEPLIRLGAWLNRPFGVTLDLAERHPWESIRRHLDEVVYREYYLGALYLSVGVRRTAGSRPPEGP